MVPTSISLPDLHTRRGGVLRRYAADLAQRLRLPLRLTREYDGGTILVSDAPMRPDVTTLVPFEEGTVLSRGEGDVLIPVGNGESGLYAGTQGLPIAKALGLPVLFYHSTWKDPALPWVAHPAYHACAAARDNLQRVENLARDMGIGHHTVIETPDGIVDGALLRALTDGCCLLIVARGKNTGKGSYVDQWLTKSPIPMLVIGRKEAAQ